MIERRKFVRLRAPIGITYKPVRKHRRSREMPSLAADISGSGVSMLVKDDLRAGDLLSLSIQIPHLSDPISAVGEVVWFSARKDGDGRVCEAGIRFRDIQPRDLNRILDFIYTIGIG